MKVIKNICLFILLSSSTSLLGQMVTFQSYMQSAPYVEQVIMNGVPLVNIAPDSFEISTSDVLPGKNIITIVPKPVNIFGGGVTAADILLMRKALTEQITLDPTAMICADINRSNFVGVEDIVLTMYMILGLTPNAFDYAFIHSDLDLSTLDVFDFGINVYELCFNGTDIDNIDFSFDVLLTGDVNQDALFMPTDEPVAEVRSENLILSLEDGNVLTGEAFEIPFTFSADDLIEVFQLEIENEGIFIESIDLDSYNHEIHINNTIDDRTRMVLVSDNPSTEITGMIKGVASEDLQLSNVISISSDFTNETVYSDFSTSGTSIEFGTTSTDEFINIDNLVISPNPVQEHFSIQIPADLLDRSTFTITNTQGQVVMNHTGMNGDLDINRSDLGASGVYILTWTHGDKSVNKKIVVQ